MRKKLVAGNWKMHKLPSEVMPFFAEFVSELGGKADNRVEILFAVPYTHLALARQAAAPHNFYVAAQNIHQEAQGAFTGEISLAMIKDLGVSWSLIGHSERRQYCLETDALVALKAKAAQDALVDPIICVGETLKDRQSHLTETVLHAQLQAIIAKIDPKKPFVLAYEPVWAIGTGVTATTEEAQAAHAFIRGTVVQAFGAKCAQDLRILYGGSVNQTNAKALMAQPDIDGALVGGASLKPIEFARIVGAARAN